MKITTTTKTLADAPKKYVRFIITEDAPSTHRLVETTDGQLEYRMGAGKWKGMTPRKFRTFVRSIVQAAKGHQLSEIALELGTSPFPQLEQYGEAWTMSTLVENLHMAAYEFTTYKSKVKKTELKEVLLCGGMSKEAKKGFDRGQIVATYINKARDIANTPSDDMTPSKLAAAAKAAAAGSGASVKVLDTKQIKQLKMGLLDAVGKGASDGPRLILIEHWGAGKPTKSDKGASKQPIVFVGKGITYDTGGLNIKPTGAMHDMHLDMSGGAATIAAVACAAKLGIKKNIIGLIPAAENAVSDRAMRAGDIVTSMSGTTVEVLHTDAEGRMVLADALTYAQKYYNPKIMLDTATLTGAALVALGQHASAIMTKDETLQTMLTKLGEESGDLTWPLPLWDEYKQHIKSDRADIANIASNFSKWGGTIEGGTFLSFFVDKKIPWAHIDIAPRMDSIASDKLAKGAAGEPVRLLVKFAETY